MAKMPDLIELEDSFLPPVVGALPVAFDIATQEIDVSVWLRQRPAAASMVARDEGDQYISREELAEIRGADEGDLQELLGYLKEIDPKIRQIEDDYGSPALSRRLVSLRGPVASLEEAFGVRLKLVQLPPLPPFIVRTGRIKVPHRLQGIVRGVFGLDTRPIGEPASLLLDAESRAAAIDLPNPVQMAAHYKFKQVATCKGQVIALMQFGGGYLPNDPQEYFTNLGVRPPTLIDVGVAGGTNSPGTNETYDREVTLDIEVAGSVADEATLVSYFAPHTERGWIEAIAAAVHDMERLPMIMSISWGAPEVGSSNTLTWTRTGMAAMSEQFEDASLIGMTVLAAAGNYGSDCNVRDWNAHVSYPASDPLVVACGGTTIEDFATNPQHEIAWERGGGGVSDVYAIPSYQKNVAVPLSLNTYRPGRGVPDISGYAYPGYEFWVHGAPVRMPGTSLVAPLYAAAVARGNAHTGTPTGHLSSDVYKYGKLMRDIDDVVSNNTSNSVNGAPGYFGFKGWDARTGLGVFEPGS